MCLPAAAWAGVSLALTAASTAMTVSSAIEAKNQNNRTLSYNQEMAERARKASVLVGAEQAGQALSTGSRVIAATRAAAAGAGADVQSPGVLSLLETSRETSAMDAETIKNNALREALGYESQAAMFGVQKSINNAQAASQSIGSIVSGAGRMTGLMASMYEKPNSAFDDVNKMYDPAFSTGGYYPGYVYPKLGKG